MILRIMSIFVLKMTANNNSEDIIKGSESIDGTLKRTVQPRDSQHFPSFWKSPTLKVTLKLRITSKYI